MTAGDAAASGSCAPVHSSFAPLVLTDTGEGWIAVAIRAEDDGR